MLSFDWPWVFIGLPLPLLVYFLLPKAQRENAALRVPFFERAESALGDSTGFRRARSLGNIAALSLIWLLLASAAMASPHASFAGSARSGRQTSGNSRTGQTLVPAASSTRRSSST